MRELINEDMFLISEIIDKINIKIPEATKFEKGKEIRRSKEEIGMELIAQIVSKIYLAKEPVNQLLANVLEKDIADIRKMPIKDTISNIRELFSKEEFINFFKST